MANAPYRLFLFVLVFSPLAFGAVEPWSLAVMETASLAALFLLALSTGKSGERFYPVPGMLPLLLLVSYPLLQAAPLPAAAVKALSPMSYQVYGSVGAAGESLNWFPVSVDRRATAMEFLRLASYGAFYIATVQLLARKELLRKTVVVLAVFISAVALVALFQSLLTPGKIFFFREAAENARPFGPYVNRNHYAGLMEMAFPLILGLFLFALPAARYTSIKEGFTKIMSDERYGVHLLGFSAVLVAATVFLSRSRGGIVSMALSSVFFFLLLRSATGEKRYALVTVAVLIALSVGWFGWGPIVGRFRPVLEPGPSIVDVRPAIWRDSMGIVRDFPLAGSGMGSFAAIFPSYQTADYGGRLIDHAHNDYIELLSDGGVVGSALAAWFVLSVLRASFRNFRKRRDAYSVYLSAGCFTGLLSIALHSATDFNLHIGANGLYFAFLLGLAVSASSTRLMTPDEATYLGKPSVAPGRFAYASLALLMAAAVVNAGVVLGGVQFARGARADITEKASGEGLTSVRDASLLASRLDPLEARYLYTAGNAELALGEGASALGHLLGAARLAPSNALYLQQLGFALSAQGRHADAEGLLAAGVRRDITNPLRYESYASWLFSRGEKRKGIDIMKKALGLSTGDTRRLIATMVLYGLGDEEIQEALPDRAGPRMAFADYLHNTGEKEQARAAYLDALSHARNESPVDAGHFYVARDYFMREGLYDDALKAMAMAAESLPDDAGVRAALAEAYERLGITYRAVEEYERALVLDPGQARARERLEALRK